MYNYFFLLYTVHNIYASNTSFFRNNFEGILRHEDEKNNIILSAAIDIAKAIPIDNLILVYDNSSDEFLTENLIKKFQNESISVFIYNITNITIKKELLDLIHNSMKTFDNLNLIYFCSHKSLNYLFNQYVTNNFMHRNFLHIIFFEDKLQIMKSIYFNYDNVVFVTYPRKGKLFLYYNRIRTDYGNLPVINRWSLDEGLFHIPTFPVAYEIYKNFHGKFLKIPVIHKPPWYFVKFNNKSLNVEGGRDDKILEILARKLNFRYEYFDPASVTLENALKNSSLIEKAINLVHSRQADLFLGDVTLTLERRKLVEFSFITLADSGAFLTHAPGRLNEAFALIQPFQSEVWPTIALAFIFSGPLLYFFIYVCSILSKDKQKYSLYDCIWYVIHVFVKQSAKVPSSKTGPRIFSIVLILAVTYVISDMYSANLTSLLAKPGREKPINNLFQLETAMQDKKYELRVEKNGSSYNLLRNGSGIYGRLWKLMNRQSTYIISSIEMGVKLVKTYKNVAIMAGRETLYYDSLRFGPNYFYISEKLNTEYSAIALQTGSPYLENINKVLITIFEAGIMTKMTMDEYEKLGKQYVNSESINDKDTEGFTFYDDIEENDKLEPISVKMLQGAFYVIIIGQTLSGIVFLIEQVYKDSNMKLKLKKQKKKTVKNLKTFWGYFSRLVFKVFEYLKRNF